MTHTKSQSQPDLMQMQTIINFSTELDALKELWRPKTVAVSEQHIFKLVKIKGEFEWHIHPTAKVLVVFAGTMQIDFREPNITKINQTITLNKGDMYLVPANTDHKPHAQEECAILLAEFK